ncbi:MAG: type II toxin-antitoxin system VapC family toxin [Acidobacteriota bacterium]|nr:type II toxin-antitoxin system VapC family toxin [Acidobacteriota bacterium]
MIGLDTNVLLRYFLNDDPLQSPKARHIISSLTSADPGWVGISAVLEFVWVLTSKNRAQRSLIAATLDQLLAQDTVVVEQDKVVALAVRQFRFSRAEFADCLIAASAQAAGCTRTVTFDRIAARDAGMELLT